MSDNFEKHLKDKQKNMPQEISGAKTIEKALKDLLAAFKAKDGDKYMKGIKSVAAAAQAEKKKTKDKTAQKFLTDLAAMVNEDLAKRSKLKDVSTNP